MSTCKGAWKLQEVRDQVLAGDWVTYNSDSDPGTMWTWGFNAYGRLGVNDTVPRSSPVQIPGTNWVNIASGSGVGHAIKADGTLWSWGNAEAGKLGTNSTITRSSPVQVPGTQWCQITSGSAVLALKTDGTLWAWGCGERGESGLNCTARRSSPTQIPGTSWCFAKTNRLCSSIALKTDGTLWTWGQDNCGQLGQNGGPNPYDPNICNRSSPIQVPGGTWCFATMGAGSNAQNSFGIKTDGTMWAWGSNDQGNLGIGGGANRSSPIQIPGTQWCTVASTGYEGHAIKTDGTLWGWGRNNYGTIGVNSTVQINSPVQIPGTQWKNISSNFVSGGSILATKTDGTLWTWGSQSSFGVLGNDNTLVHKSSPVQIPGTSWSLISRGGGGTAIARKV